MPYPFYHDYYGLNFYLLKGGKKIDNKITSQFIRAIASKGQNKNITF